MEKNVIWAGGKDSVSPFHDFLKGVPLTPLQIDSLKNKLSKVIGNILQRSEQDIFQLYLNAISNIRSKIHPMSQEGDSHLPRSLLR
jgi:hypothetical protein